jgi:hypothetical protein
MSRWLAQQTGDGAHVLPIGDVVEHIESDDCVCGPRTERVERTDGGDGWLTVHHSLDGREATE